MSPATGVGKGVGSGPGLKLIVGTGLGVTVGVAVGKVGAGLGDREGSGVAVDTEGELLISGAVLDGLMAGRSLVSDAGSSWQATNSSKESPSHDFCINFPWV